MQVEIFEQGKLWKIYRMYNNVEDKMVQLWSLSNKLSQNHLTNFHNPFFEAIMSNKL